MNRNKIIVPIDLSQDSTPLLKYASSIAQTISARITCVYVTEDICKRDDIISERNKKIHSTELKGGSTELRLAEVVSSVLNENKVHYELIVTKGDFYQRISSIATEFNASLIILNKDICPEVHLLLTLVQIPLILYSNKKFLNCKNIIVPLNLEGLYYQKIKRAIATALLLKSSIIILPFNSSPNSQNEQNEENKFNAIQSLIEKENLSGITRYVNGVEELNNELNNIIEDGDTDIVLLLEKELFEAIESSSKEKDILLQSYGLPILLIPDLENGLKEIGLPKMHCFTN